MYGTLKPTTKKIKMIHKILHRLLHRRHFWRHASFNELSQIYISSFFRALAFSLVGIFIPIFLYELGYDISEIVLFFVFYFSARIALHIPSGFLVARIGPKHGIIFSFIVQLVSSVSFLTLPDYQWPLWLVAGIWAVANTIFFTAYHVDFSKVKHSDHSGKEMGFANILQRVGGALGPITGGAVATIFGAQYIFLVMMGLLLLGLLPLLTTPEPVKTRQKIRFRNLKLHAIKRDIVSYIGLTVAHQLSVTLWPLYLGIFALGANVYLELGVLSSIGFVVSIFTAYAIGKTVDRRRGRELLHISALGDMFVQFFKPFVGSFPFALFVNTAGESTAVSMRIAYQKGMYDAADDLPGNRIVYISVMEMFGAIAKVVVWLLILSLGLIVGFEIAIIVGFIIAGLVNLLTLTERFKAL